MHVEGKEELAPGAAETASPPAAPKAVIKPLDFQVTAAKFLSEAHVSPHKMSSLVGSFL